MPIRSIGDHCPAYTATAVTGGDLSTADVEKPWNYFTTVSSNDHNGMWRILLFWPEDANGISGLELEAFGRANDSFAQRGAQVLGVSVDTKYTHFYARVRDKNFQAVPFPLLSDHNRCIGAAAGVLNGSGRAERATFIVDPQNRIRYVSASSAPAVRRPAAVLDMLADLQAEGQYAPRRADAVSNGYLLATA
jgi:alkyl hydroperoxide reductase subunit AhpC